MSAMPDLHRRSAAELAEDRLEARIEILERRVTELRVGQEIGLAALEQLATGQSVAALAGIDDARGWLHGQPDDEEEEER